MKKTIDCKKLQAEFAMYLTGVNNDLMVTSEQAARIIGVTLRTIRNWEKAGRMPPREAEGCYPRRYRLVDIRNFAKRHKQILALQAMGFDYEQLYIFSKMPVNDQKRAFVSYGCHPSLWP